MKLFIAACLLAVSLAQTGDSESDVAGECVTPPGGKTVTVYYIRHGESIANSMCTCEPEGCDPKKVSPCNCEIKNKCKACLTEKLGPEANDFVAKVFDAKLNTNGENDANDLKQILKQLLQTNPDDFLLVSSPNLRALGTAALGLSGFASSEQATDTTVLVHPSLRETGSWCDVGSTVFHGMGNNKIPTEQNVKVADDYIKKLEEKYQPLPIKFDWTTFFGSKKPNDMWIGKKGDAQNLRDIPVVLKDLINKAYASPTPKKNIIISAHSNMMKVAIAEYAADHLACPPGTTSPAWNKLTDAHDKMANGAILKFDMTLVGEDEADATFEILFSYDATFETKDYLHKCMKIAKCTSDVFTPQTKSSEQYLSSSGHLTESVPYFTIFFLFLLAILTLSGVVFNKKDDSLNKEFLVDQENVYQ